MRHKQDPLRHARKLLLLQRLLSLRMEGLRMLTPLSHAEVFHASTRKIRLLIGSNRCLGEEQKIYDPVAKTMRRIDSIDSNFHVYSRNPSTGVVEIAKASKPFIKGRGDLYRIRLTNGESFVATLAHRIMSSAGNWISVASSYASAECCACEASDTGLTLESQNGRTPLSSSSLLCRPLPTRRETVGDTSPQLRMDCEHEFCGDEESHARPLLNSRELYRSPLLTTGRRHKASLLPQAGYPQLPVPSCSLRALPIFRLLSTSGLCQPKSPASVRYCWQTTEGCLESCSAHSHPCDAQLLLEEDTCQGSFPLLAGAHARSLQTYAQTSRRDDLERTRPDIFPSSKSHLSSLGVNRRFVGQFGETQSHSLGGCEGQLSSRLQDVWQSRVESSFGPDTSDEAGLLEELFFEASHPSFINPEKVTNNTIVSHAEYLRNGEIWDFSVDGNANYLMCGLTHANSSKTLTGALEFARAVCGCDPHDKFPKVGKALVVTEDYDHVAEVWAKLTRPGEFKMIRDERTQQWRAVRPDPADPLHLDPYDMAYQEKWRDGPPIIPPRAYTEPAWENRGREIPRYVRFNTGWQALFRSSEGSPQKGTHNNLVWFDEQIVNELFFAEARRALVAISEPPQHIPRMIWTATPQITNTQLQDYWDSSLRGAKHIGAFKFLIRDNPYIPDDEKQSYYDDIPADDRPSRWHGEFALTGKRIYATYQPMGVHGCEPFPLDPTWARYFIVDPGTENCATIFLAVPPDESHVYVYDGFVVKQSNLTKWSAEVARVAARNSGYAFEAAVIDNHAGLQHQMGLRVSSTAEEYWQAVMDAGISIRRQASVPHMGGFFPGSANVEARQQHLLKWMDIRGYGPFVGTARLQVMRGVIPELDQQIKRAHIDPKTGKRASDSKVGPHDILDCLE